MSYTESFFSGDVLPEVARLALESVATWAFFSPTRSPSHRQGVDKSGGLREGERRTQRALPCSAISIGLPPTARAALRHRQLLDALYGRMMKWTVVNM